MRPTPLRGGLTRARALARAAPVPSSARASVVEPWLVAHGYAESARPGAHGAVDRGGGRHLYAAWRLEVARESKAAQSGRSVAGELW